MTAPKILVIDDDIDFLESLKSFLLSRSGSAYAISTCASFSLAMQLVTTDPWDVIILDKFLKDGDGCDIFRYLKAHRPEKVSRVIFISGHGEIKDAVSIIKSGAFDYIEKPFDPETFYMYIEKCIAANGEETREYPPQFLARAQAFPPPSPSPTMFDSTNSGLLLR